MNVTLLGKAWELENEVAAVEQLFRDLNSLLTENDVFLSFMKIDDVEIFEDYHEYILTHLQQIRSIGIGVQTVQEIINNILISSEQYLERAIPLVPALAEEFYQKASAETWEKFAQLAEGMQWLHQMLGTIVGFEGRDDRVVDKYHQILTSFEEVMPELNDAVENKDGIAIGDCLNYEVISIIKNLSHTISETIDSQIVRPHVN